jgi:CheY-specific phosphatase CheX
MEPIEVQAALAAAVEEVLETMCFTAVFSSSEAAIPETGGGASLMASLRFEGKFSGEFLLVVALEPARTIGSGFLGKEEGEISDSQAAEVVCELANMFCGTTLSRLETETTFSLSHPELVSAELEVPCHVGGFTRWFELEEGSLAATLSFRQAS